MQLDCKLHHSGCGYSQLEGGTLIRSALILALLIPLTNTYRPQYIPTGVHFPVTAVLNPCLISAWPMNEGSGTTLHDTSTGGTNTATVNNIANITWGSNPGFPGSSIAWTLSGHATATSTTLTNFDGTTPFSVSAWTTASSSSLEVYMTNESSIGSATQGWLFAHNLYGSSQDFVALKIVGSGGGALEISGSTNYSSSGPHFVVATYDGSRTPAGVKLYVDGTLQTTTTRSNSLSATSANGLAPTFNSDGGGSFGSAQTMGYVEVYNCVVTAGFVSSSFAAGPGIY